ncbi:DUF1995 family protein [Brasilonema sp. UFV-L1]|uniref:DUF1995 family protein n=1 Tax=Brasilonema sp. UFV-L1 TaxID=2234130 RepID=UPI00145FB0C4|nr:DUF1995 family protein [Brasilonema sp. UFV-L1]NMG09878.1 DUF1995 domain-containing protein [Brasilonema sp. UFV-L1]
MTEFPKTLEDAIAQAGEATKAALAEGYKRLQIEILIPELKPILIAEQFLPVFEEYGSRLKVFFPDAGGAALAVRDWADVPFKILDIGTGKLSLEQKIEPEDEIFFLIAPTVVEVIEVEKIAQLVGDRPLVILNPRLEDLGAVGIGYAARQLRERFVNTIERCYYLRPIDNETAVFRCYPKLWEVWLEKEDEYQKIAEFPQKPSGDELDLILAKAQLTSGAQGVSPVKPNLFKGLQRFLRALRN